MGNRKFVPHPVGADAHIGPLESCEFAVVFHKKRLFSLRFALFFKGIWFLGIPNFK